ncbi:hypothetical protein U1Q18_042568, partial [Sarracenia purpurea var. burkii]
PDDVKIDEGVNPKCLYGEWKKWARVSKVVPHFAHNVLDELPQKVLVPGEASNNLSLHFLASVGNFPVSSHQMLSKVLFWIMI